MISEGKHDEGMCPHAYRHGLKWSEMVLIHVCIQHSFSWTCSLKKKASGAVERDPCQEKQISGLCIASARCRPEYLSSICDFRAHRPEVSDRVDRLHLCRSGNFRLKLLRVEFSSKQIAPRISPHNLPFTDPRNHTVWVLRNQLTVAQTVDGYAGGFMIGIACAAGFMCGRAKWEKDKDTRSAKALLPVAPPDAWWAKWASVLTPATESRPEACARRTTQTHTRFLANRTLYIDQMHKLSRGQPCCTISLDYSDRADVGVQRPGPQSWKNAQSQCSLKWRQSQLWQLPAIFWDVLALNIQTESSCH